MSQSIKYIEPFFCSEQICLEIKGNLRGIVYTKGRKSAKTNSKIKPERGQLKLGKDWYGLQSANLRNIGPFF